MTAEIVTILFLPVFLLLRRSFRRIPLHIDAGFYVSNHTISSGRFSYSKGWNARYAGCSKVLPELFYSLFYLFDCREDDGPGKRYKSMSRLWISCFSYLTAVAVGLLCAALANGGAAHYCAGLIVFALLSSEPHYGAYHECGETFQLLTDVAGVLLVIVGLSGLGATYIAAGAFVWLCGAFYTKLSAAVGFPILFGAAVALSPQSALSIGAAAFIAVSSFAVWVRWNGQRIMSLLSPLRGHEKSFDLRAGLSGFQHRLQEKARTAGRAIRSQPILPLFALVGLAAAPPTDLIFWAYLAAVAAAYVAQATDCRYYLLPFLPPLAVLTASGVMAVASWGDVGTAVLAGAGAAWVLHNTVRAARMNTQDLNAWSWKGGRPVAEVQRNLELDIACQKLAPLVAGQSVLVYGPCNQAYVLLNASYPTAIVAPEYYLDHVCPGWQAAHNEQLVSDPPQWVLDTGRCFSAREARSFLGLDYRVQHVMPGEFRLYKLMHITQPSPGYAAAKTFAAQSAAQLDAEVQLASVQVTVSTKSEASTDPAVAFLKQRLHELASTGKRRIALYGAGRFTIRHADLYRHAPVTIVCVVDDNTATVGPTLLEWPVRAPDDVDLKEIDAILVSTDRFAGPILARVRRLWGDQIVVLAAATTMEAPAAK